MILESTTASVVVHLLAEQLSYRLFADPSMHIRYLQGDDSVEWEAIAAACTRAGVTPEDYLATLEADPTVRCLHHDALTEAIVGTADPGPHDQISRESPSGDVENRHFNDWMLRKNSP